MSLKMKPRKSLVKRLRADPDRQEIVVGAQVEQFGLDEPLIQGGEGSAAREAVADVGADHGQFAGREIIDVEGRRQLDAPVDGPKRAVAVEQVQRQEEILRVQDLVRIAKEVLVAGIGTALKRRGGRGHLPRFDQGLGRGRHFQKDILADDRVVALEDILVVRVPPVSLDVRIVIDRRMLLIIAVPFWEADPPAVLRRDEVVVFLPFQRHDP